MTFRDRISNLPDNRVLLRTADRTVDRDAILGDKIPTHLAGIRVAICFSDVSTAVRSLAMLDGIADRILLLSSSWEPELLLKLARLGSCSILLCDDVTICPEHASIRVLDNLTAIDEIAEFGTHPPTETRWVLATSGTTNEPKLVSHSLASLTRTSKTDTRRGTGQCWGMVFDHSRFAGLQVLLQSMLSGAELLAPSADWALEEKIDFLVKHGCSHLSGTPTLWRKMMMVANASNMPLLQATLGGEIADDRVLKVIAQNFPNARVTHIYASTEAGVGFSVSDGREGFPKDFLNNAPTGVEIKEQDGRLFIRNSQVEQKYLNIGDQLSDADGWVDSGDLIELKGDRVYFVGRESGVINVGGDKVHPEVVEGILMSFDGVAAAHVYAKKNPITGAIVAADFILSDRNADPAKIRSDLRVHAEKNLKRYQVPALFKIVDKFETNAAGKILRTKA